MHTHRLTPFSYIKNPARLIYSNHFKLEEVLNKKFRSKTKTLFLLFCSLAFSSHFEIDPVDCTHHKIVNICKNLKPSSAKTSSQLQTFWTLSAWSWKPRSERSTKIYWLSKHTINKQCFRIAVLAYCAQNCRVAQTAIVSVPHLLIQLGV